MSRQVGRYARDLARRAAALELPQAIAASFGRYKADPVGFCVNVLAVEAATRLSTGEPYQFSVLRDLVTAPRVAVRSGHGTGKTALDAWAAIWWLITRPSSRVIVLAPEYSRQIKGILFSEVRKWVRWANRRARDRGTPVLPLKVLASRVLVENYGEEWSATGMSTAGDVERLEGFHADGGVLVIVDEMKAVPQEAFDSVQGALSGLEDSRLLVTSVPGGAGAGPFWKACQDTARWRVHHLPSTDSSLVAAGWLADRVADWGIGSPLYQSRVLGQFADAGEGVLYPLPLLEAAVARVLDVPETAETVLGVDVSRSVAGDQNCVAQVRGGRLERLTLWRSPDLMQTVAKVLACAAISGAGRCRVDATGIGAGAADRLRQLGKAVDALQFGGAARDVSRFVNMRAEGFWRLRERLERGEVTLLPDEELLADLSAIRYEFDQRGRIKIEGKDDCRRRLGRSPDRADALMLALAPPVSRVARVTTVTVGHGGLIIAPEGPCSCYGCRHGTGYCANDHL